MEKAATLEDFKQSIVQQHMPDDPLAQQALDLAIEMMMYSIWLARKHKEEPEGPQIITRSDI